MNHAVFENVHANRYTVKVQQTLIGHVHRPNDFALWVFTPVSAHPKGIELAIAKRVLPWSFERNCALLKSRIDLAAEAVIQGLRAAKKAPEAVHLQQRVPE